MICIFTLYDISTDKNLKNVIIYKLNYIVIFIKQNK